MNNLGLGMKKKFIMSCAMIVAVLGIGFAVSFVSKAVNDNKGYRTIGVVETKGTVTVVKDGIDYKAYSGMHLQEGQILVTAGESSARLVLDGDKYLKVEGGSRVVFEKLGFLGSGKTKIILERGSLNNELVNPLQNDQEFVVNTPNAVLAVRGTFFRVALETYGTREVRTNVLTYGGVVAAKRIFPTGETEEEEVLVDSGYKTAIHMNAEDTFYVLGKTEGAKDTTGDDNMDVEPIYREDISDDDWVDIYYSVENGHELFITVDEAKKEIEERKISLENTAPIYQKAAEVFPQTEETESAEQPVNNLPDDSKTLVREEGNPNQTEEDMSDSEQELQSGLLTDGNGKEDVIEEPEEEPVVESVEDTTTIEERVEDNTDETDSGETEENGEEITGTDSEVNEDTENEEDTGEDSGSEENTGDSQKPENNGNSDGSSTHTHTEVYVGSETVHSKCSSCGEILSTTHEYTKEVTRQATCTTEGTERHSCVCGYSYEKTVDALGHNSVNGGEETVHSKCSRCGEVLSTIHEYTDQVTKEATCTEEGILQYSCVCGYFYEKPIDAIGHTPVNGGEADIHSKCLSCGEILSTTHEYTDEVTLEPTCVNKGEMTHICDCGHSYTEEISTVEHNYVTTISAPTDTQDGNKYDTCEDCGATANEEIIWGINLTNFPDEEFRNYVEATYNTDGEVGLCETEIAAATSMTITADVAAENLYGIELFTALQTLAVDSDYVQEIDVSSNAVLSTLTVSSDTVSAAGLTKLNCSYTAVSVLNVDGLNNLTRIDAVNCSNMGGISAQNCLNLTYVDVASSSLYNAAFDGSSSLVTLNLSNNEGLTAITFRNCSSLSMVDVTNCGKAQFNCIIYGKESSITSEAMITGFDSSYMTYWTTQ